MKTDVVIQCMRTLQCFPRELFSTGILNDQLYPLISAQIANNLRINPWNRFELPWPIEFVMRPRQPGCGVRLPFRWHSIRRLFLSEGHFIKIA